MLICSSISPDFRPIHSRNRAISQFREALALNPGDEVARIYVQRCEFLMEHPPETDWDGV
jgi:hypothetical protein